MPERTCFFVGSYYQREIEGVTGHAQMKGIGYETIRGPRNDFLLADGSKVTVPEGQIAVVLRTQDPNVVSHFWDGFDFPDR